MATHKLDKLVAASLKSIKSIKNLKVKQLWKKTQQLSAAETVGSVDPEVSNASASPNMTTDVKSTQKASHSEKKAPPPPLEDCPICHDPVGIPNPENVTESWTSLHCGHRFGDVCIQTWLQDSLDRELHTPPSCPICRTTAKHPKCGHPVSKHDQHEMQFAMQTYWRDIPRHSNGRPRQRLRRRETHPHRPPPPPKKMVDTIGECRTCAANAAYEARLKQARERLNRRATAPSSSSSPSTTPSSSTERRPERRSSIKSYVPSQVRNRWSTASNGEPSSPMDSDERGRRVQTVFACGEGALEIEPLGITRMPRSPTPVPPIVESIGSSS